MFRVEINVRSKKRIEFKKNFSRGSSTGFWLPRTSKIKGKEKLS